MSKNLHHGTFPVDSDNNMNVSPAHSRGLFFEKLVWLTTEEAAQYLRKSVNAIRIMVYRNEIRARKHRRRLYFRRDELDAVIESSQLERG